MSGAQGPQPHRQGSAAAGGWADDGSPLVDPVAGCHVSHGGRRSLRWQQPPLAPHLFHSRPHHGPGRSAPMTCTQPRHHRWHVAGSGGRYNIRQLHDVHARTEKKILNTLWPTGEYTNKEQTALSRGPSLVHFQCTDCQKSCRLLLQRPRPELVYVPQIRVETSDEGRIVAMYEKLVQVLREVESELDPPLDPQVTKDSCPELCKTREKYFVAPINMLQAVGFERVEGVYRIGQPTAEHRRHAKDMRQALEKEIRALRMSGGDVEQTGSWLPWDSNALLSKMSCYADNVNAQLSLIRHSFESDGAEVTTKTLADARQVWSWCAAYWYYEYYSIIRSENRYLAHQLLNCASRLVCEVSERLWAKGMPKGRGEGFGMDPVTGDELPSEVLMRSADHPTDPTPEMRQRLWWAPRLFEAEGAELWLGREGDPVALVSEDAHSWANPPLLALLSNAGVRSLLWSVDVSDAAPVELDDPAAPAVVAVQRLQALAAAVSHSQGSFAFSGFVVDAFNEYAAAKRRAAAAPAAAPAAAQTAAAAGRESGGARTPEAGGGDSADSGDEDEPAARLLGSIPSLLADAAGQPSRRAEDPLSIRVGAEEHFPLTLDLRAGANAVDEMLLDRLTSAASGVQEVAAAPDVLCLRIRRSAWSQQAQRVTRNHDPVTLSELLTLDPLCGGDTSAKRSEILRLSARLQELRAVDPTACIEALTDKLRQLRSVLSADEAESPVVAALREEHAALESIRRQQLDSCEAELAEARDGVLADMRRPGRHSYRLSAVVVTDGQSSWVHVSSGAQRGWSTVADKPLKDLLGAAGRCVSARQLADVAHEAATGQRSDGVPRRGRCAVEYLFYDRVGDSRCQRQPPAALLERIGTSNARLRERCDAAAEDGAPTQSSG